jgi:hypothetical protein
MQINYVTGRRYGKPQVLEITATPAVGAEAYEMLHADFVDAVRGIAGRVKVFAFECTPELLGSAVLEAYDECHYIWLD